MDKHPDAFGFSVSHTTRGPRPQEVHGQHYHFVPEEEMQKGIESGDFVEHAHVHGSYYGTSHTEIKGVMNNKKICILDIDVQGVAKVQLHPTLTCRHVFIMPPSIAVLEERLRGRQTETEDKIQKRLGNAQKEIDFAQSADKPFDAIIVNADVEKATDELLVLLKQWHPEYKW